MTTAGIEHGTNHRHRLVRALPWLWLALSAIWAAAIFATDQLAWPLALWIATTLGPLTVLRSRMNAATPPPNEPGATR